MLLINNLLNFLMKVSCVRVFGMWWSGGFESICFVKICVRVDECMNGISLFIFENFLSYRKVFVFFKM